MADFEKAVDYLLKNEGGLEERESDPGGITNHGISLRFLKAIPDPKKYGLPATIDADTIRYLTVEKAIEIYKGEFWNHAPFSEIYDQDCCNYIFDMAVNMGIAPSVKCAQRACWSIYRRRNILLDDGILGTKTLEVINKCANYLIFAMRSERAGYYRLIAEQNPKIKEYLQGWLNRSYIGVEK